MKPDIKRLKRTRKVTIRFLDPEYEQLYRDFQRSAYREFSHFLRQCLLKKKITIYTRNVSLDGLVGELGLLRCELTDIRSNVYRKPLNGLHTSFFQGAPDRTLTHSAEAKKILEQLDRIQEQITQIADQWWHASTAPKA